MDPTLRAWIGLMALSLIATVIGLVLPVLNGAALIAAGAAILIIAAVKARVILAAYLELAGVPGWLGAYTAALAGFVALALGLFALG